jgi:hypothetical protein
VLRAGAGDAAFPTVGLSLGGIESTRTYHVVRTSGATVPFSVTTRGTDDAVYKLTVGTPVALDPTVAIVSPVVPAGTTLCANRPVTFTATAAYPDSALPVSSVQWLIDGVAQPATALSTLFSRPPGTDTFTVRAFGASASITVTFAMCTATAEILTPAANVQQYAMVSDTVGPYLTIDFTARAVDAMGNVIDPSTLVFEWSTDRGDLQPGAPTTGSQLLGTGASLTGVKIYGVGAYFEQHVITLTIRASPGGPVLSTDSVLVTVESLG